MKNLYVFNEEKFAKLDGNAMIDFFGTYQVMNSFNTVILDNCFVEPDPEFPKMETVVIQFRANKGLSNRTKNYEYINHRSIEPGCKNISIREAKPDPQECATSNPHDGLTYDVLDSAPCESVAGKKQRETDGSFKDMPY